MGSLPTLGQESTPEDRAPNGTTPTLSADTGDTVLDVLEVTGTAIRRANAETALPVTVLKVDSLREQGMGSIDELIQRLGVNNANGRQDAATTTGQITGGASFANLRGIGSEKTLVLLNGRRVANNALNSAAIDLNMIPFEALDQVQILRDGASALYGSDAIGGVINFITKKNYRGGNIQLDGATPTAKGGGQKTGISGSWGLGDLGRDNFNVMSILSYRKDNGLPRRSRHFIDRGGNPHINYTGWTYDAPANYYQGNHLGTPVQGERRCRETGHWPTGDGGCGHDAWNDGYWSSPREQFSSYTEGRLKLSANHTAGFNFAWTRNHVDSKSAPNPISGIDVSPDSRFYPGNGLTPLPQGWNLDATQPVQAQYLTTSMGLRSNRDTNDSKRLMFTLDGTIAASWRYDTALYYNANRLTETYNGGWMDDEMVRQAVRDGVLNPFAATPSAAGQRALRDAQLRGTAITAKGDVYTWDGRLTGELGDWLGAGPASLSLGAEARHEKFQRAHHDITGRNGSTGVSPEKSVAARRDVQGAFAELNLPLLKSLEVTGSLRYDKYARVGSTSNPKVSFRFQPISQLVVRGSYSEGFSAPTLHEMYTPKINAGYAQVSDPVLCPGGQANTAQGGIESRDCNGQFAVMSGGNKNLQPQLSKNWTLGFVLEPAKALTASVDFWWISIKDQIGFLSLENVVENEPAAVHRKPDGSIDYIDSLFENVAKTVTNGVDLGLNYTHDSAWGLWSIDFQGTYTGTYRDNYENGYGWISSLGTNSGSGLIVPRWKHALTANWSRGTWNSGIANSFQTSYQDWKNPDPMVKPHATVASYTTWDAWLGYQMAKGPKLTVGVKNIFDKEPPFSNDTDAGFDPMYFDPTGRTLYGRLSYSF